MSYSPPPAYQSSQPEYGNGGEPPLWAPWYGISLPNAVRRALKKYATFSGRASRSEFWWWALGVYVVDIVLGIIRNAVGGSNGMNAGGTIIGIITLLFSLAVIVPYLAVFWRRLHDTNKSGGWFFLGFIPIIGTIIVIVFLALASKPEGQRFDRPSN
ncbi:hypothetical protein AX769_19505 [Frondihabitans sp. PAMC 28766]|uniref:DUF805 domain-containing protein n=1 Tax=Frondihabitans sp. PAMC 28766 TaxID=1795630 RepID=UPI00078C3843|nr:DUF805 domain-containing protein [Frondihabitans sp. PAMC 28766]AMM21929.1 hypothetical protein AX769_19505 [Frondihabitans sp. PAMC 28766]